MIFKQNIVSETFNQFIETSFHLKFLFKVYGMQLSKLFLAVRMKLHTAHEMIHMNLVTGITSTKLKSLINE